jgi:hypothetical protein
MALAGERERERERIRTKSISTPFENAPDFELLRETRRNVLLFQYRKPFFIAYSCPTHGVVSRFGKIPFPIHYSNRLYQGQHTERNSSTLFNWHSGPRFRSEPTLWYTLCIRFEPSALVKKLSCVSRIRQARKHPKTSRSRKVHRRQFLHAKCPLFKFHRPSSLFESANNNKLLKHSRLILLIPIVNLLLGLESFDGCLLHFASLRE